MTTQLEEVVAHPYPLHRQHLGPDIGQGLFQLGAWRHIVFTLQLADLDHGQCLAVQFAIGIERQVFEPCPMQRHHVLRQLGAQTALELLQTLAVAQRRRRRHQITHQVLAVWSFLNADRRIAHLRLLVQTRLNFTQFNAIAADLHLMVDAAHVLQHPVQASACQIAGAVQALARRTERVRHKHRRRAQRIADITAPDPGPGYTQLANGTQRNQLQVTVEQVQTVVVGRCADGQITALG